MAATPASPPTIAEEDEEKGEKEDLSNHFLAIGFQVRKVQQFNFLDR